MMVLSFFHAVFLYACRPDSVFKIKQFVNRNIQNANSGRTVRLFRNHRDIYSAIAV